MYVPYAVTVYCYDTLNKEQLFLYTAVTSCFYNGDEHVLYEVV
jgi:hypothetical protein